MGKTIFQELESLVEYGLNSEFTSSQALHEISFNIQHSSENNQTTKSYLLSPFLGQKKSGFSEYSFLNYGFSPLFIANSALQIGGNNTSSQRPNLKLDVIAADGTTYE